MHETGQVSNGKLLGAWVKTEVVKQVFSGGRWVLCGLWLLSSPDPSTQDSWTAADHGE